MRKKRIDTVIKVLQSNPKARDNGKELLVDVWVRELDGNLFTPENIKRFCSSPSGIDRDRRRPEVLKRFPRSERKFNAFKKYTDEMSDHKHLKQLAIEED